MPTSADVVEAAGITWRQLDYWCQKGWLRPTQFDGEDGHARRGSGLPRDYSDDDLATAVRMAQLIRDGFMPSMAAVVARGGAVPPPPPEDPEKKAARLERRRQRAEARQAALEKLAKIHSTTFRYLYNEEIHARGLMTTPALRRLGGIA